MTSPVDGLLVVDKPFGVTSHDVVATVRKLFGIKKVGHAGTLDPAATGVLVLGVGKATRLLPFLVGHDKTYRATIRLGVRTLSDDAQGVILQTSDTSSITSEAIKGAMLNMTGVGLQTPPSVSARHVEGERAYKVVMRGETPVLPPREVCVNSFNLESINRELVDDPDTGEREHIDLEVVCEVSSGTYVRALARDLGEALGVGGHVGALRRLKSGPWVDQTAISIQQVSPGALVPMAEVAAMLFPIRRLDPAEVEDISHGRSVKNSTGVASQVVALIGPDGRLLAMAQSKETNLWPTTVFSAGGIAGN